MTVSRLNLSEQAYSVLFAFLTDLVPLNVGAEACGSLLTVHRDIDDYNPALSKVTSGSDRRDYCLSYRDIKLVVGELKRSTLHVRVHCSVCVVDYVYLLLGRKATSK